MSVTVAGRIPNHMWLEEEEGPEPPVHSISVLGEAGGGKLEYLE